MFACGYCRRACPQSKFVSDTIRPASNFQAQARLTYDVEGFEPLGFIEARDVVFLQHVSEIVSEVVCEKGVWVDCPNDLRSNTAESSEFASSVWSCKEDHAVSAD
jgi:hypothetical protein